MAVCAARRPIGLPSTGKTTLFQLMTSAKDAPRGHGKTETAVGISKVPDDRLDRLTAMYNPRKRVPATIEFTDIVAPGPDRRRGARRRRRLQERRCAGPRRPRVSRRGGAAPGRIGRSGARRAGDGRRADPRRPRRRRAAARAARQGSEEEQVRRAREGARSAPALQGGARERPAAARARPRRRRSAPAARVSAALRQAAAARDQPRRSGRRARRQRRAGRREGGPDGVPCRARRPAAVPVCAKIELEIAALEPADAAGVSRRSGPAANPASTA